jgi:hypothetical protein
VLFASTQTHSVKGSLQPWDVEALRTRVVCEVAGPWFDVAVRSSRLRGIGRHAVTAKVMRS